MRDAAANLGTKTLALAVLLIAAYLLFQFIVGAVSALLWTFGLILVVIAAVWALAKLF